MRTFLAFAAAVSLAACTPAHVQRAVTAVDKGTSTLETACAYALPLSNLAIGIPTVGPFIAAGVQVGCSTGAGLNKLAADPNSVAWLNQQIGLLRAATGK